jgi:hypothetical protein
MINEERIAVRAGVTRPAGTKRVGGARETLAEPTRVLLEDRAMEVVHDALHLGDFSVMPFQKLALETDQQVNTSVLEVVLLVLCVFGRGWFGIGSLRSELAPHFGFCLW